MKTDRQRITEILNAFPKHTVQNAVRDWAVSNVREKKTEYLDHLKQEGWIEHGVDKPEDTESIFFNNIYWTQKAEFRRKDVVDTVVSENKRKNTKKDSIAQTSELTVSNIKCPTCNAKMYKQAVCPACKEGRAGYRIRLICENDVDHEILL